MITFNKKERRNAKDQQIMEDPQIMDIEGSSKMRNGLVKLSMNSLKGNLGTSDDE